MGLFSFLRKNKQESTSGNSEFYTRAEEASQAVRSRGKRKSGNQTNEPADPALPEKKRARRRLVGAMALVLAAIIGLPMVLDSEPKPLNNDIAIQIPSRDKPFQPSVKHQPPSPSASLDPTEEMVEPQDVSSVTPSGTTDKPKNETKKESAQSIAAHSDKIMHSANKAESKAESGSMHKPESKAIAKPPVTEKADDPIATAILEGATETKVDNAKVVVDKKQGKFAVQVAALASQEKISQLQDKLKDAGITSYTQKVPTELGERTRIRVGPFANKEEAEQMCAKLVKLGLNGTLIPPRHP